jgi:hypothetical protein
VLRSVANLTRKDGLEFMELVSRMQLQIRTTEFALEQANDAIASRARRHAARRGGARALSRARTYNRAVAAARHIRGMHEDPGGGTRSRARSRTPSRSARIRRVSSRFTTAWTSRNPGVQRQGRAPNVKLRITRKVPVNPPAALRRFVSATNEVAHTEHWRAAGEGYLADLEIDIKSVPVRIKGTKGLQPARHACRIEWRFDVTSGVPLLGTMIAAFAGEEIRKSVEDE